MSRHYVFTSYKIDCPIFDPERMRYLVFQKEQCPATGRYHWQGYAELLKPMRLKGFQSSIGDLTAHCETRKGTRSQAREYCMKEDSRIWGPYEKGVWEIGGQGTRNDVKQVVNLVRAGKSDKQIADEMPETFMRMAKGIRELRAALSPQRKWPMEVYVYFGKGTGQGKSFAAHTDAPGAFTMTDERGWWDGYDNHSDVIIDDFRAENFSVQFMLKLLDRYPMRVPIKGSSAEFVAKRIIITTNDHPSEWYNEYTPHIMRRINRIIDYDVLNNALDMVYSE